MFEKKKRIQKSGAGPHCDKKKQCKESYTLKEKRK